MGKKLVIVLRLQLVGSTFSLIGNYKREAAVLVTYKFIERVVSSTLPDTSVMSYNIADVTLKKLQAEVHNFHELVHQLTSQMTKQQAELSQIKLQVKQLSKK